jgi:hypothetical protein
MHVLKQLVRLLFWGIAVCAIASLAAQTELDTLAWDSFTDYLVKRFPPASPEYIVQFPSVPFMASWGNGDRNGSEVQLEEIAGTVPPDGLFWKPGIDLLADRYGALVDALQFPIVPSVTPEKKADIVSTYFVRLHALDKAVLEVREKRKLWLSERKAREQLTLAQSQEWWRLNATILRQPSVDYEAAVRTLDSIIDPTWPVRSTILSFRLARLQAANNVLNPGGFPYDGSAAALTSLVQAGKSAHDAQQCRANWRFDKEKAVREGHSRSFSSRAKVGSFVSVHETTSQSEEFLEEEGSYISVGFCAEGYIPLRPGPWFSSSLLDLLRGGQLKIERTSPLSSRSLFDEDGLLPRVPTGLVVGYEPHIEARFTARHAKLFVEYWNSGKEIDVGPLHLVNDGAGTARDRSEVKSDGSFTITALGESPYVIAIVSKRLKLQ